MQDGRALQGETCVWGGGGTVGGGRGRAGTARVMSHDAKMIGSVCNSYFF